MTDGTSLRVLVVDDDPGRIEIVEEIRLGGLECDECDGVESAIAQLRANPTAYDVVLIDMRMPDSNGRADDNAGLKVLSEINTFAQRPTAIILTAHGTPPNTVAAIKLGAAAYLDKVSSGLCERIIEAHDRRKKAQPDKFFEVEFALGRSFQEGSLPQPLVFPNGLSIAGTNVPAWDLSGDMYHFHYLPKYNKLFFLLCDAMGKALSGAYVAQPLQQAFLIGAERNWDLCEISQLLHRVAVNVGATERHATGILGVLYIDEQRIDMISANHLPVIGHDGAILLDPDKNCVPWGYWHTDGEYVAQSHTFLPGHALVCYSDGLTDFGEDRSDGWGIERLQDAIRSCDGNSAQEMCDQIMYRALEHGRLLAASIDDLTILVLHWSKQTQVL